MADFVLHTGVSKTGSTTLQFGFSRHSDVNYLGKSDTYPGPEGSRSEEVFRSLNTLVWRKPFVGQASSHSTPSLPELLNSPLVAGRVTVASWEAIGSKPKEFYCGMLERLISACPKARIFCCLRHPASWLVSTYLQHLRGQFIMQHRNEFFGGRPWMPIEEWLDRSAAFGFHGLTRQLPNIRAAVETFGRDRVGVFLFEQLQSEPEAYYRGICEFVGIDHDEMFSLLKTEYKNPRLSRAAFEFMQRLAETPALSHAWRTQSPAERRSMLISAEAQAGSLESIQLDLPANWQQCVATFLADDAAWLQASLDIPLTDYGYTHFYRGARGHKGRGQAAGIIEN